MKIFVSSLQARLTRDGRSNPSIQADPAPCFLSFSCSPAIIIKATNLSSLENSPLHASSSRPKRPRLSSSTSSDQLTQQAGSSTDAPPPRPPSSRRRFDGPSDEDEDEEELLGRIWDNHDGDHHPDVESEGQFSLTRGTNELDRPRLSFPFFYLSVRPSPPSTASSSSTTSSQ